MRGVLRFRPAVSVVVPSGTLLWPHVLTSVGLRFGVWEASLARVRSSATFGRSSRSGQILSAGLVVLRSLMLLPHGPSSGRSRVAYGTSPY